MQLNGWSSEPKIIFCSEDCYKNSSYSKQTSSNNQNNTINNQEKQSKPTENIQQQTKSEQTTSNTYQEPLHCSAIDCHKIIPTNQTYYYNSKKNDNQKFCSKSCYQNYYGEI